MSIVLDGFFRYVERIDMKVPDFLDEWDELDDAFQLQLASAWAKMKGVIPEKIQEREKVILDLIEQMYLPIDFDRFCQINDQMTDLAAEINELNIWSRFQPNVGKSQTQGIELDDGRVHG